VAAHADSTLAASRRATSRRDRRAGATDEPAHRQAARYVWALLLARIYEVLPLLCPTCGGAMRIIAFITEGPPSSPRGR